MGRPDAEMGPVARGGAGGALAGRAGGAGGRGAEPGAAGATGLGRPLEMKPLRAASPTPSVGAVVSGAAVTSGTTSAGAIGVGAGAGSGAATGAGVGASTTSIGADASTTAGVSSATSFLATSFFATAFFATAFFATAFLATAFLAGFASSPSASSFLATAFFATAFFAGVFFSGFGSSGCSSRTSPSRSARRRTRSACASMIDEEWLLMSMPIARHKSTASLLVRPSSLASSWTRMFFAKLTSAFHDLCCIPIRCDAKGRHRNRDIRNGPIARRILGSAQCAAESATPEGGVDARRTTAQPRTAPVRCRRFDETTIDDHETHERTVVETTTATHARACRTMTAKSHYSAASGAAEPPAHSFSLTTLPSAACHSISPVASLVTH